MQKAVWTVETRLFKIDQDFVWQSVFYKYATILAIGVYFWEPPSCKKCTKEMIVLSPKIPKRRMFCVTAVSPWRGGGLWPNHWNRQSRPALRGACTSDPCATVGGGPTSTNSRICDVLKKCACSAQSNTHLNGILRQLDFNTEISVFWVGGNSDQWIREYLLQW